MRRTFRGCYTAIVTPFNNAGKFDEPAMRRLVEWQIEQGIDGIVVCGTTGESPVLSKDETRVVMQAVIDQANSRIPVICGTGTNNTADAVARTKTAESLGADGILSVVPYYNKPTQAGLLAHFEAVAKSTKLPVILYNVPSRTGVNMKASTTLRLAEISNIAAIKEASGDMNQVMDILAKRPAEFSVLSGDDALTLPMIGAGGDGVISVVSNQIPQQFTECVKAALANDMEKARELHYTYYRLMQMNFIESNPIPVKTSLAMMGKVEEVFRLPLVPMQPENRFAFANELKACGLIKEEKEHVYSA